MQNYVVLMMRLFMRVTNSIRRRGSYGRLHSRDCNIWHLYFHNDFSCLTNAGGSLLRHQHTGCERVFSLGFGSKSSVYLHIRYSPSIFHKYTTNLMSWSCPSDPLPLTAWNRKIFYFFDANVLFRRIEYSSLKVCSCAGCHSNPYLGCFTQTSPQFWRK